MTETIETKVGKFKTREKLVEFVGFRGNISFITDEATIESKYLSGLDLDDVVFKLTICDNNTVNFDEVDTEKTTEEQRERLLNIIFEKSVIPYNKMMVIRDLPFKSVKKVNDKSIDLYLSVDIDTPIMRLASIFDGDENVEVSENQNSKIENLLSMFDEEDNLVQTIFKSETDEELLREFEGECEPIETKSEYQKSIEDSFKKMKEEKLDELRNRLNHQESELKKFNYEKLQAENKIEFAKKEISVLESRIDSIQPIPEPNGYCFFVSERLNEKITLDEQTAKLIHDKVSKLKSINADAFMKLFEQGEFQIRLGHKVDDQIVEFTNYENLSEDIKKYLIKNNVVLRQEKNVEQSSDGAIVFDAKLVYSGDMTWHDIVNKMIKGGFTQEPEFDKMCGSNSYFVGFGSPLNESVEENKMENMIKRFDEFEEEDIQDIKDEFEEVNGYPIGDDFIFSILSVPAWDPDYADIAISISPKSYWDNEGFQFDQHLGNLVKLPDYFEEVEEGSFVYKIQHHFQDNSQKPVVDCINDLLSHGIKFNIGYQNFMEKQIGVFSLNGVSLTQYMQTNHPNSII